MRALVTGAAGFIGSRLATRLSRDGHDVVGFDDLSEGRRENLADAPDVDLVVGDLRDRASVREAAAGCEVVFHQGAMRSVPRSMEAPAPTMDVNVGGTVNVLLGAREAGARVVFASSSSIYGDQERFPVREDAHAAPKSPYAASKLVGEELCATWWRAFGVPTVALRYYNVYGPHQDPESEYAAVVPKFIRACLQGRRPVIHGDGEQSRDFTFVEDVVEANVLAAAAPEAAFGRAFNVGGGGVPTSVNRLLEIVAGLTGARPDPVHEPPRPGDVRRTEGDLTLAAELLGYRPAVDVETGLACTVEWMRTLGS